jgi:hypothetical protein
LDLYGCSKWWVAPNPPALPLTLVALPKSSALLHVPDPLCHPYILCCAHLAAQFDLR